MLNFLQTNNIMDMTGLDEKFKPMIGEQLDIQRKLKPIEQRLGTLKKHLEQSDIYFKYKGKKPLTETEQILFTAARDYLKGVMNGKTALPIKAWKEEYTKLTTERKTLNQRYLAAGTAGTTAPQKAGYGAITDRAAELSMFATTALFWTFIRPINWNLYLYRFNQMMFKKGFKGIRSTAMFNNFSVYDFINIHPCNFQNLIRRCYSNKFSFVRSPHNKF